MLLQLRITTLRGSMGCQLQMGRFPISKNCYVVLQLRITTLRCSMGCAQMCWLCHYHMCTVFLSCPLFFHGASDITMAYHTQYDCECGTVLRSVTDEAIQAPFQGKTHKKRMQECETGQDYECDCRRKLVRVKAFRIKQHCESPLLGRRACHSKPKFHG